MTRSTGIGTDTEIDQGLDLKNLNLYITRLHYAISLNLIVTLPGVELEDGGV